MKTLCSSFKHPLPNIFQGTAFEKHAKMLIKERSAEDFHDYSFSCLPPQTAKEKKIFFGNVHLHPIDCSYEDFSNYPVNNNIFYP